MKLYFPVGLRILVVLVVLMPLSIVAANGVNYGLILFLFFLMLAVIFMRLEMELDAEKFTFRLCAFHWKSYMIHWAEVESVQAVNAEPIGDFLGWGVRYNPKYGWSYVMEGGPMLVVKLKDGRKRSFTTGENEDFHQNFLQKAAEAGVVVN